MRRGEPLREPSLAPARVRPIGGEMAGSQRFSYEIKLAAYDRSAIERDES